MERTLKQVRADPVFQVLNPEGKEFMGVCWLPSELNQFADRGIRVVALIPFRVFPHIKTIPTVQMMLEDFEKGLYVYKHTIVVDSSGNTVHAAIRLASAFGFKKVIAVTSTDAPASKIGILESFGDFADVLRVSKPEETARELGEKPGHYHLNQYGHMGNIRGHELHTGPEIVRVLGGDISKIGIISIAMGSGGTVGGVGRFFKRKHWETTILGAQPSPGEDVPGARNKKKMQVVTLPWKEPVNQVVEISRKESFIGMRQLWNAVEPQPGPTSGLAYRGLIRHLENMDEERLLSLRGKFAAFICPDDGRFYPERITGELNPGQGI
jgi:cysteine synthase